jgi:hypothetical protein
MHMKINYSLEMEKLATDVFTSIKIQLLHPQQHACF